MVLLVYNNIFVNNYLIFLFKKKLFNNNRRSCWSGAHCHRGSLMAVSTMEASPAGCRTAE